MGLNDSFSSGETSFISPDDIRQAFEEELGKRRGRFDEVKAQILPLLHENRELNRLNLEAVDDSLKERELRNRTEDVIRAEIARFAPNLSEVEVKELVREIVDEALGLGPLEPLLADPSITEIMVNGPDRIFVERNGKTQIAQNRRFAGMQQLYNVIERIVAPIGRRVDESSPAVDARLVRDGSRVHIIIPPLAITGPTITIRKFPKPYTAVDLENKGSFSHEMLEFLKLCVVGRKSIIVSGGTGSGKTTLLNVLSEFIPEGERIITVEDSAELQLRQPNLVSLESRRENVEGKGSVSIRELVRNTLRMRPDRIVVGECRGPEAFDMMQAMNTGHEGSLTTIHSNSPIDMLNRLENLILMAVQVPVDVIRHDIASAVDVVVQISRLRDGSRKITDVSEVLGIHNGRIAVQQVFGYQQTGITSEGVAVGGFYATGKEPTFLTDLQAKGLSVDRRIFRATGNAGASPGEDGSLESDLGSEEKKRLETETSQMT